MPPVEQDISVYKQTFRRPQSPVLLTISWSCGTSGHCMIGRTFSGQNQGAARTSAAPSKLLAADGKQSRSCGSSRQTSQEGDEVELHQPVSFPNSFVMVLPSLPIPTNTLTTPTVQPIALWMFLRFFSCP